MIKEIKEIKEIDEDLTLNNRVKFFEVLRIFDKLNKKYNCNITHNCYIKNISNYLGYEEIEEYIININNNIKIFVKTRYAYEDYQYLFIDILQ